MTFQFAKAVRKKAPVLVSLAGVSGSGKTYSALLLAAGLAGEQGRVGLLDAENGRGAMYADSPSIRAALPDGYGYAEIREPFSPGRFADAVEAAEEAGVTVLVIDSFSHEWEGVGGCSDIAEANAVKGVANWIKAKLMHKRLVNRLLGSPMHLIFCLRARDKVKVEKIGGRQEFTAQGLQPICEKNFVYEMTLSLLIEEGTHRPVPLKVPEPLVEPFFAAVTRAGAVIDCAAGAVLRRWADGGETVAQQQQLATLLASAEAYARQGTAAYQEFWLGLSNIARTLLLPQHDRLKGVARDSDSDRAVSGLGDAVGDAS